MKTPKKSYKIPIKYSTLKNKKTFLSSKVNYKKEHRKSKPAFDFTFFNFLCGKIGV